MRRIALTLITVLALALMTVMSTGVALAGWGWEDCPPASKSGQINSSPKATDIVSKVHPPAADVAWETGNPGNKFKTK